MNEVGASVLLVADDGPDFGLGHLRRLEFLQKTIEPAIRKSSTLISREMYPPACRNRVGHKPFWQEVCEELASTQPLLCVFDLSFKSWETTWAEVQNMMPLSAKSIGVDVPVKWGNSFDHVIHPGIANTQLTGNLPTWHGGPEWVLAERVPHWSPRLGAPIVTVTTGSQAFESFHEWLPSQLGDLADAGIEVNWVVGKHREEQISHLNSLESSVTYVSDIFLAERFAASTVVLTRFGVTAFELTARGVPTIILPGWTEGEEREVMELERCKLALVAKSESEVGPLAHQLAEDRQAQMSLSMSSKAFFEIPHEHPASRLVSQIVLEKPLG